MIDEVKRESYKPYKLDTVGPHGENIRIGQYFDYIYNFRSPKWGNYLYLTSPLISFKCLVS